MEEKSLRIMIEKFFNAELTIEEEGRLCSFLREHDVPSALRRDKETILALCDEEENVALPTGAEARLEAMLDTLAANESHSLANENNAAGIKRTLPRIPRNVWRGAVAAVLIVAGCIFINENAPLPKMHTQQPLHATAEQSEQDTFDNPEDAMRCFKEAMGEIKFALNATRDNAKEIEETLKISFTR